MTTPLDLITSAVQDIGAVALGEPVSAEEGQAGFVALNDMLDAWNTESLLVYNVAPQVFDLTPSKSSYTFGPGGDFDAPYTSKIESAYARDTSGADFPITVSTDYRDYAGFVAKTVTSSLPVFLYDDGAFPLRTLNLYPVPDGSLYQLVLWSWSVITSFTALNQAIQLPPAYARAIKKNLALEIAPSYGRVPSDALTKQAYDAKAQIARINFNMPDLVLPARIPSRRQFNMLTGYAEQV